MKRIYTIASLLVLIIGKIGAVDIESYHFIDHLTNIPQAGAPELFEDGIIFTAPASNRRVGVAFAHEGFAKVYWFQRLLIPRDQGPADQTGKKPRPVEYDERPILFYLYNPPEDLRELGYRLVIDGLWSTDPLNLQVREAPGGLTQSVVTLPPKPSIPTPAKPAPGALHLSYQAPPGETITVAGDFNGWDPFMYELRETGPGLYTLALPLPPGTYRYVFFYRGERITDPNNPRLVYTREGKTASEAVVR